MRQLLRFRVVLDSAKRFEIGGNESYDEVIKCEFGATAACVCLGVLVAMIVFAMSQLGALNNVQYFDEDWSIINGIYYAPYSENPFYVGGIRRVIGLFFLDFLPGGQLAQFYEVYSSTGNMNPAAMLCGSLVFAVGTTLVGMILFRKKDLK